MNDYTLRILYILNLKEMTGYGLAKRILSTNTHRNISNGALMPAINNLLKKGLIYSKIINNKKYYFLTDSGKKLVNNLMELNDEIKNEAIIDTISQEFPYINVFTDINDFTVLKNVIKKIGPGIINLIRYSFILEKNGQKEKLNDIINYLNEFNPEKLQKTK
ncbi:PadR family transcriptional regulator [Acidiplasma sp.]|uniref:PadR family transcriptional regulator n=1 Tax=Acidiplasma sp. TaxID=1872114 RepID=UPI00258B588D|nr:PadR family transcriptional regulator [Acidiplasma sp.]